MFDTAPPSIGRPPSSSRSITRQTHDSVSVTDGSGFMKQLIEAAVRMAKQARAIPLFVNKEETRELASFGRKVMQRIDRSSYLTIVDPGENLPQDLSVNDLHGVMIISSAQVSTSLWATMSEVTMTSQLVILCSTGERDWRNILDRMPTSLKQRLGTDPLNWPRLSQRKHDLPDIIEQMRTSLTDERGRVPVFSADAINWLLERPGESTAQLYSRMKKAVAFARELGNDFVANDHLDAIEKKDKRAALRSSTAA